MQTMTWILFGVVTLGLIFDFTNGFHDSANAIATSDAGEATVLDVWFPAPALGEAAASLRAVEHADESLTALAAESHDADRRTEQKVVFAQINLDAAPADTMADSHPINSAIRLPTASCSSMRGTNIFDE